VAHCDGVGGTGNKWPLMGFFASLIAYLGAVTGIVLALVLPLGVLLSGPGHLTIPHEAVAMTPKLSEAAAIANATMKVTPGLGRREPRIASDVLNDGPDAADETSRKQSLQMPDRREPARRLTFPSEFNFASRYMGYVDDPSADRSFVR
jgi:hypothetical protein